MKNILVISVLMLSISALAQKNKTAASTSTPSSYGSSTKVLGGNVGLNQGAINVGFTYDSGPNNGDLGGSFFLQTEKEDSGTVKVNQVMTFGAHVNMNLFESAGWVLDLRPGVNISMIKDIQTSATKKDDKTVIGPALRWTVAHRFDSGLEVGIDRLEIWNWFDDDAPREGAYTTLVFRKRF
jgi:hypothetical protein